MDYSNNYDADIALVALKGSIEFQAHISPICISYGLNYAEMSLLEKSRGKLAGWGHETHGQLSPILKKIELPVVKGEQCISEFPQLKQTLMAI